VSGEKTRERPEKTPFRLEKLTNGSEKLFFSLDKLKHGPEKRQNRHVKLFSPSAKRQIGVSKLEIAA
jgi:hypothetical protein